MILASSVIKKPEIVDEIKGKYQILYDQSLANIKFNNMNKAICIMAEKDWKCISITTFNLVGGIISNAIYMYALMEKQPKTNSLS